MKTRFKGGHRIRLLENGEEFYPCVFDAIRRAQREVLIETFIVFDDKVGVELRDVLIDAGKRGLRVELTLDGYGSHDLSHAFYAGLIEAGVRVHVFDPKPKLLGLRTNIFRRLHRKLVAIDTQLAFVGGINYSADHLGDFGPEAKQDYAVEIEGPIAADIREFMLAEIGHRSKRPLSRAWRRDARRHDERESADGVRIAFVTRDNDGSPTDIERQYRVAIRAARREIVIANAYFFPGLRFIRDLRRAARRGVKVFLILQGQPDMPMARWAATMLYDALLRSGIRIYEYCERPLHAKVACIDDEWSTVGSSNLDPLSLSLNLEANVIVRDREFNRALRDRLGRLMLRQCRDIGADWVPRAKLWRATLGWLVFHFVRHYPSWSGWMPGHHGTFTSPQAIAPASGVAQANVDPSRPSDASSAPNDPDRPASREAA